MIARNSQNIAAAAEESLERGPQVPEGTCHLGVGCLFGKYIPSDDQHVDIFSPADVCHPLDTAAKVIRAVLSDEAIV